MMSPLSVRINRAYDFLGNSLHTLSHSLLFHLVDAVEQVQREKVTAAVADPVPGIWAGICNAIESAAGVNALI